MFVHMSFVHCPENTRRWPKVVLMLVHRLRRCPSIKTTLDQRLVFSVSLGGLPASTRHPPNVGPMLVHRLRRWPNIGPTLSKCLVFAWLHVDIWRIRTMANVGSMCSQYLRYWPSVDPALGRWIGLSDICCEQTPRKHRVVIYTWVNKGSPVNPACDPH